MRKIYGVIAAGLTLAGLFVSAESLSGQDENGSKQAFLEASAVLFHPRCLNCHPSGDAPLQTDQSTIHAFGIKRGPEGKGVSPLNCTMCHRETNTPGGAPGVRGWHMPSEKTPMVFQGRTPAELCRQLKDPKENGGLTGDRVIEHMLKDPLVLHAWNPGETRTTPPLPQKEFAEKISRWAEKGFYCPE